jgi:hypothetical protein
MPPCGPLHIGEQTSGAFELVFIGDPDFGLRLVGWNVARDAAGKVTLHAGLDPGLA